MAVPLVVLTGPTVETFTLAEGEGALMDRFKGLRGIYLVTNVLTGKQYIGSSNNLGKRLPDYFRLAYHTLQSNRGGILALAVLKYGLGAFKISAKPMGDSLPASTPVSLMDHVVAEQWYLDTYALVYNARRKATPGKAPTGNKRHNIGAQNPSSGLKGAEAFAWGSSRADTTRKAMSRSRGVLCLRIFSPLTGALIQAFDSASQFSAWFGGSARLGADVAKAIASSGLQAVEFISLAKGAFITTMVMMCPAEILALKTPLLPGFNQPAARAHKPNAITIYGRNITTGGLETWLGKEACTKALTGRDFVNKKTLDLRLDVPGAVYKGYEVRTTPFE